MCLRGSPTSHKLMFQQTSGIDQGTKDPVLCFKEFKVNNLMLRKGGTTEGLRKGYYDYQNTPRVNRNMLKTQKRKHQRMRRDTILAMQHKNVPRSLVFDRISEGPSPRFEKKFSIKDHEEKEMIMDSFKSSFEDS